MKGYQSRAVGLSCLSVVWILRVSIVKRGWPIAYTRQYSFHPLIATTGVQTALPVSTSGGSWTPRYQSVSKIWNILEDGTLQATLLVRYYFRAGLDKLTSPIFNSDFPEPTTRDGHGNLYGNSEPSSWTTTTMYLDTAGLPISFAKEYATPNSVSPETNRPLLKAVSATVYRFQNI